MPGQTSIDCRRGRDGVAGFNGGPGNCPAKPLIGAMLGLAATALQWRAGQLPGQTCMVISDTGQQAGFNGGPGNCPAKPLVKIGALDLPVCGRLRAVVEA